MHGILGEFRGGTILLYHKRLMNAIFGKPCSNHDLFAGIKKSSFLQLMYGNNKFEVALHRTVPVTIMLLLFWNFLPKSQSNQIQKRLKGGPNCDLCTRK